MNLTCFKAYDIRGQIGEELNEDVFYRVGRAFATYTGAKKVAVGGDIRLTSESFKRALSLGLTESGCDVIDLGMTGTEEVYFAVRHLELDGGIEITASHNPIDYNGMKIVVEDAKPMSNDSGLLAVKALAEKNLFEELPNSKHGKVHKVSNRNAYVDHLLNYIDLNSLRPMKVVVNAGNGAAGPTLDAIDTELKKHDVPIEFIRVNHEPDGQFPNGIPNPLLPENRSDTRQAVLDNKADFGIAWDGDFDRCFLFDEKGEFIEGYYIVGLLAEAFLTQSSEVETIIHDPRLYWNTESIVEKCGGVSVQSKTGHAFIKERMRAENAIYGGEMSAHHYFRDFGYCDSGMIPWLLVTELLSIKQKTLSDVVADSIKKFPSSGEINIKLDNPAEAISIIKQKYTQFATHIENVDGLSMTFDTWRFNLRSSNTEPVVRLNVESKDDIKLMEKQTKELLSLLQ
ncbi:phosphomannomutase [Photobacterium gaetbulicola Gung47]|uniref:phosphomannomutase n=2 Tax=Photobacterium gaetbulicola TaxID=1295392 RepID=A0A0C5WSU1_9GAMM|nr:phosphomannomutase [Photobacterium gaetbulicola Gung47]